jgi:trimethylamine--corrinoid protein Co-methyltransferase
MQMVREGTPLIYATLPTVADMRTGAYASGGIECGMLHMAHAQMAHFYNVPCGGYIGLTNSKVNDAQSGYETGLSTMAGVLSGMDMMNMGGLIEALKTFDFAKAVIDDEIAQMLKRMKRGLEFSEENLAVDIIKKIGPGGSYIVEPHTIKRMKTAGLLTKLSDRDTRTQWEKKGAHDIHDHAMARVRDILAKPSATVFSPEVEERIRAHYTDLISADMEVPEGLQLSPG